MTTKNDLWTHDLLEGAPFRDFVKLAFSRLKLWPREGILYILMHNDPNGVWRDEDSIREFGIVVWLCTGAWITQSLVGDYEDYQLDYHGYPTIPKELL